MVTSSFTSLDAEEHLLRRPYVEKLPNSHGAIHMGLRTPSMLLPSPIRMLVNDSDSFFSVDFELMGDCTHPEEDFREMQIAPLDDITNAAFDAIAHKHGLATDRFGLLTKSYMSLWSSGEVKVYTYFRIRPSREELHQLYEAAVDFNETVNGEIFKIDRERIRQHKGDLIREALARHGLVLEGDYFG